jgi:hypothetical protein
MGAVDAIFSSNLAGWGAFTVVALLVVVSIVRGWLVPKATHERELAQEKTRGDEALDTARELRAQNSKLLEAFNIVQDFFKKVPVKGGER